ncbi:MAG: glycosyltransferase [Tatlockia sp.]|nr:glycosyltransferase [Tatlockia sp.]
MKLVFFTPVIKSSAIGRMACLIVRQLISDGHEVDLIRIENEIYFEKPTHDFGLNFTSWTNSAEIQRLSEGADALIYQIGDNYELHIGALEWLAKLPGIVCLHDFFLGNLFHKWAKFNRLNANAALRSWCGAENPNQLFRYTNSEDLIAGTLLSTPMTEWLCAMAQAVVTHSNWGIERVLNSCPGPVHVIPLAYDAPKLPFKKTADKNKFEILTVGNVNKNKRIESIITAIGKNRQLRKNSLYRLVGEIPSQTRNKLAALAKKSRVNLVISGQVDDAILIQAIEQADVITCLRSPVLEASSASAIEAMLCGKPIIVTNHGFYSEIPDHCAIKINPDNEIAEIQSALTQFINDPEQLSTQGLRGQLWAKATFRVDNYAAKLIEIAESTTRTKVLIDAINYFNQLMHGWGVNTDLGRDYIMKPLSVFDNIA